MGIYYVADVSQMTQVISDFIDNFTDDIEDKRLEVDKNDSGLGPIHPTPSQLWCGTSARQS